VVHLGQIAGHITTRRCTPAILGVEHYSLAGEAIRLVWYNASARPLSKMVR
jgi:hypothetical protein